jgi:hypothetical protein
VEYYQSIRDMVIAIDRDIVRGLRARTWLVATAAPVRSTP